MEKLAQELKIKMSFLHGNKASSLCLTVIGWDTCQSKQSAPGLQRHNTSSLSNDASFVFLWRSWSLLPLQNDWLCQWPTLLHITVNLFSIIRSVKLKAGSTFRPDLCRFIPWAASLIQSEDSVSKIRSYVKTRCDHDWNHQLFSLSVNLPSPSDQLKCWKIEAENSEKENEAYFVQSVLKNPETFDFLSHETKNIRNSSKTRGWTEWILGNCAQKAT